MSNQIRPPGFPPVPNNQNAQLNQRNNQNRFNQNQNRGNNFNQGPVYQPLVFQPPAYQAPAPQTQGASKEDFSAYVKANDAANDAVMRNMQTQGQNMQNQLTNLTDLLTKFMNSNNTSTSSSCTLPSNTIANPRSDLKAITTRSGVSYDGPQILPSTYFLPKVVENKPEATKDPVHPINNESTKDVQPQVVQSKSLILNSKPVNSPTIEPVISPNSMNEHCSAVLLKKLLEKLGDPSKFLIPCDFTEKAECLALPDLDASINLMPLSVWNKLFLLDLTSTCMTVELADRLISRPVGVAEDVYVKVGSFHFLADFIVVDFDADPRVPLILGRSFLKTESALIDVFEGNYLPEVRKELKIYEPSEVELKDLPPHLKYVFLEGDDKLPVIAKDLSMEENTALITVLKSHNRAILGNSSISRGGFIVVENEDNELIPTRQVMGWRVCIDYRKLNEATRKNHFPLPFMDQMLERLAGNQYYCFLEWFFGYFQIPIDPKDQEKTTFTFPYGMFAYRRMPFGLCNAPGTFQRYMMAIFHDMIEKTMEVFMDDFFFFKNSFQSYLSHLERMMKRCEDTNLCLNWEKSHFMVKEDSQMHNNIMAAGSSDRPPMLAPRRYTQWRSRFLRYVDTRPNGEALRKCILRGPYKPTTVLVHAVEATDDSPAVLEHTTEAIERLQQGESLNIQDVKTNLFLEFGKFTSHDRESMELYYTRFYKLMNEMIRNNLTVTTMHVNVQFLQQLQPKWSRLVTIVKQQHKLDEVSYHKLFDILKQYQNEVNELRAEKLARNANPLALYFKKIYKPTNNNLRTSSNSKNKNVDMTPRYKNDDHSGQFRTQRTVNVVGTRQKECRKPKRVKDSTYHKEKMLLCKQAEQGVPLQAEQYDWLEDTDEEVDEQVLEAHYSYMAKIQEVPAADSGIDLELVEHVQNNAGYNVFANHQQHSEQSESVSNTCLVETDDSNIIPDSPDMCEDDIQNDQNDVESDDEHLFRAPTAHDIEILIQTCLMPLAVKTQSDSLKFVHELKQEMHADLMYVESLEKEIDELESEKAEFSDMYNVILQECVSKDVMCSYLMSLSNLDALDELQCMYLHKVKECDCLAQKLSKQTKSVSKKVHTELLQRFAKVEKHSISLELALQKCKEHVKNDTVCNEKASNVFRKEREQYYKIQDLKAKLQDKNIAIGELKKLIERGKGKSVDTKFDRPSVVRQPNAQRIPKPSVLGKPTPFSNSLDRIYFKRQSQFLKLMCQKVYRNQSLHKLYLKQRRTLPPLKSNQLRDKVLPNNSQVKAKKTQVEVHPRIPSVSNKMKSVTACKDSLNSRTLNAYAVCATCNKCLVDSNHFACVTKMLNDVHARTKKPNFAPILGYGDLVQGNVTINKVYYVEGLNHNLFSVGQFCDADLEVAFRKSTCFVRDLQGND
nr:reverse transcriptase domain-containing protein [Tanacetum cinerariifolium]